MQKILEVRDRATFIPVIAFSLDPQNEAERYLMASVGYGRTIEDQKEYVFLTRAAGGTCTYDFQNWEGSRTMQTAHHFIGKHWDTIESGDVIDVEYILGETPRVKSPQREETYG